MIFYLCVRGSITFEFKFSYLVKIFIRRSNYLLFTYTTSAQLMNVILFQLWTIIMFNKRITHSLINSFVKSLSILWDTSLHSFIVQIKYTKKVKKKRTITNKLKLECNQNIKSKSFYPICVLLWGTTDKTFVLSFTYTGILGHNTKFCL